MENTLKIYTDGGARGNPGPAAAGIALYNNADNLIKIDGKYLGEMTNNQAEYNSLILALQHAQRLNAKKVTCYLDSELIVKQLTGKYKTKSRNISKLKEQTDKLAKSFDTISFIHVKRDQNKISDKLVNIVLDAIEKSKRVY
jgi:ribonuclease HI